MVINCGFCKKDFEFKVFPGDKSVRKYCNRICMAAGFVKPKIVKICDSCGQEFSYLPYERKYKNKYCSIKCIKHTAKELIEYKKKNPPTSFWKTASDEQKLSMYKKYFDKYVIKNEECWGWSKSLDSTGSGLIGSRTHMISAYRASWLIHKGPITDGLWVLHKCDNRACSNPDHLYLGTNKDNIKDKFDRNRDNTPYGINHFGSILDNDKVLEIRQLLKEGYSYGNLSKKFGVAPGTIQNIKEGRTWKHVRIVDGK